MFWKYFINHVVTKDKTDISVFAFNLLYITFETSCTKDVTVQNLLILRAGYFITIVFLILSGSVNIGHQSLNESVITVVDSEEYPREEISNIVLFV